MYTCVCVCVCKCSYILVDLRRAIVTHTATHTLQRTHCNTHTASHTLQHTHAATHTWQHIDSRRALALMRWH